MERLLLAALGAGVVLVVGCAMTEPTADRPSAPDAALANDLALVARSRVFFGHQSVGADVLAGLRDLSSSAGVALELRSVSAAEPLPAAFLVDALVGVNGQPTAKCADFSRLLSSGRFADLDVALVKFCYLDISAETDVNALARDYEAFVEQVRPVLGRATLVHVTVPLKAPEGLKGMLKRLLRGQDPVVDNVRRNQFNQWMRQRFAAEPVFDLARAESTLPGGTRTTFEFEGQIYEQLAPNFTNDGGHLNALGRQLAAREFVSVMAGVLRQRAGDGASPPDHAR